MKYLRFGSLFTALLMFTLLGLNLLAPTANAAFGTSPPWVKNDHLLPGTTYKTQINLSRSNPTKDMGVEVRFDGDEEIEKWVKIEDLKKLVMKKGETILPVHVTVKVPKRAAIGDYKGGIFITLKSIEEEARGEGGTVAIRLGSHISVELTVTGEQVVDYNVRNITAEPINQGEPFYINLQLDNLGNTPVDKVSGKVDVYNEDETEILKTLSFKELPEAVDPDSEESVKVYFENVDLEKGSYWLHVKAFKEGEVVYENRLFQSILSPIVPLITAEDLELSGLGPKLPSAQEEVEDLLKGVAEKAAATPPYLVYGVIGISIGVVVLLILVVVLVVVLKKQQQANIQRYLTRH